MDDKRHVGFVDAHAECVGRHHNLGAVKPEVLLVFTALVRVQTGMVATCGKAAARQQLTNFIHCFAGGAVHDAALSHALAQQGHEMLALVARLFGHKGQVRTVKTGYANERIAQSKQATMSINRTASVAVAVNAPTGGRSGTAARKSVILP